MQEGDVKIESLGVLEAFQSQAQFIKQATKNQYELLMEMKDLDHQNQVFNLKMDKLSLQNDINAGKKQVDNYRNMLKLLTLQRDKLEKDTNLMKVEVKSLNEWVQLLQSQKQSITDSNTKEVAELSSKLEALEAQLEKQKTEFSSREKQLMKQKQKLNSNLQQIIKKSEENENRLSLNLQETNDSLYNLKQAIIQKLQPFKTQQKQFWTEEELLDVALQRLLDLENQLKKIQAFLKSKEGKNNYAGIELARRVEAIGEQYQRKIDSFQRRQNEFSAFLNRQVQKYIKKHQFCYGSDLQDALSQAFVDLSCQIQGLNIQIQGLKNQRCKQCEFKDDQMKNLGAEINRQKKKQQEIQNNYISMLTTYQNQSQQAIQDLKKQNKKIESELNTSKLNLQKALEQNKKKDQLSLEDRRKTQETLQQKQSLQAENKKLLKDLFNLNNQCDKLIPQIQKQKKELLEKQQKIKQVVRQAESNKISLQRKESEISQQLNEKKSQIENISAKLNKSEEKYSTLENKYSQKLNEIDEIDNKLCKLINLNCLGRQDRESKSYKQAFAQLQKFFENPPPTGKSELFKIPSLSSRFQQNIDWVVDIIAEYTDKGKNFTSKFLGKVSQAGADFNKYFENPNILLICQTKKATFQVFVTKICKGINDRFKVVAFSAEKKCRYPKKGVETKGGSRPSTINTIGQLVFGGQEIILNRNLQMVVAPRQPGYFADLDINQMFGMDSPQEKPLIEAIEFYQIIYE